MTRLLPWIVVVLVSCTPSKEELVAQLESRLEDAVCVWWEKHDVCMCSDSYLWVTYAPDTACTDPVHNRGDLVGKR